MRKKECPTELLMRRLNRIKDRQLVYSFFIKF